jgi:hypothetical protein
VLGGATVCSAHADGGVKGLDGPGLGSGRSALLLRALDAAVLCTIPACFGLVVLVSVRLPARGRGSRTAVVGQTVSRSKALVLRASAAPLTARLARAVSSLAGW